MSNKILTLSAVVALMAVSFQAAPSNADGTNLDSMFSSLAYGFGSGGESLFGTTYDWQVHDAYPHYDSNGKMDKCCCVMRVTGEFQFPEPRGRATATFQKLLCKSSTPSNPGYAVSGPGGRLCSKRFNNCPDAETASGLKGKNFHEVTDAEDKKEDKKDDKK